MRPSPKRSFDLMIDIVPPFAGAVIGLSIWAAFGQLTGCW